MQSLTVDIGCHTGVTSKTINWVTNAPVVCVDPMLSVYEFRERFRENTRFPLDWTAGSTSQEFFERIDDPNPRLFAGFCIDGDHEPGMPLLDAQNALKHLADTGVILFHDGIGRPVREAVTWLLDQGFKARCYWTPHIVFACWRGDFTPPVHQSDPRIDWAPHRAEMWNDFYFGRLS